MDCMRTLLATLLCLNMLASVARAEPPHLEPPVLDRPPTGWAGIITGFVGLAVGVESVVALGLCGQEWSHFGSARSCRIERSVVGSIGLTVAALGLSIGFHRHGVYKRWREEQYNRRVQFQGVNFALDGQSERASLRFSF
jgi:hypothetical protein